jgi:putative endonuclease
MAYVCIRASWRRVLYVGVTSNLPRRIAQHRSASQEGFTARDHVHRLVHVEPCESIEQAIRREKRLKGWRRQRKLDLITAENAGWVDLAPRGAG